MTDREWTILWACVLTFGVWLLITAVWPQPAEKEAVVPVPVSVDRPSERSTPVNEVSMVPAGQYKISHYEPWVTGTNRTASGRTATDGVDLWVAAHPDDFPIGTELLIDGYGVRTVEDTGVPRGTIDVLVADYDTAIVRGVRRDVQVWRIE